MRTELMRIPGVVYDLPRPGRWRRAKRVALLIIVVAAALGGVRWTGRERLQGWWQELVAMADADKRPGWWVGQWSNKISLRQGGKEKVKPVMLLLTGAGKGELIKVSDPGAVARGYALVVEESTETEVLLGVEESSRQLLLVVDHSGARLYELDWQYSCRYSLKAMGKGRQEKTALYPADLSKHDCLGVLTQEGP